MQSADIDWAVGYWQNWQRRIDDEKQTEWRNCTAAIRFSDSKSSTAFWKMATNWNLLTVLRHMAQASGGAQATAEQARLNPTQIYRTLSPKGNPALSSLSAIPKAMGLRLAVQPLSSAPPLHVPPDPTSV